MTKEIHNRLVFSKGKTFIKQGDIATTAFLIQSGKVRVFQDHDGERKDIATLGAGQFIGEMALIRRSKHSSNVEALEETVVISVSPDLIELKLQKADPLLKTLINALLVKLDDANSR